MQLCDAHRLAKSAVQADDHDLSLIEFETVRQLHQRTEGYAWCETNLTEIQHDGDFRNFRRCRKNTIRQFPGRRFIEYTLENQDEKNLIVWLDFENGFIRHDCRARKMQFGV